MTEGRDAAKQVVLGIFQEKNTHGIDYVLKLDNHNMRGIQIERALEKAKTIPKLCEMLEKHDPELITYVNLKCLELSYEWKTKARFI